MLSSVERAEYAREARKKDNERFLKAERKYTEKLRRGDPVKYSCRQMVSSAGKRAKKAGLPMNITTEYIMQVAPAKCPVLGVPLEYGGGPKTNSSPSIDRIIPEYGYVEGNVQVVSLLANQMKSSASTEELLKFSDWVRETYGE